MKKVFVAVLLYGALSATMTAQVVDHVELRVAPLNLNGPCPATFHFQGIIQSTGYPGVVYYRWEYSDNRTGPVQSTSFRRVRERRIFNWNWSLTKPSNVTFHGGMRLHVLRPQNVESPFAGFTLHCK